MSKSNKKEALGLGIRSLLQNIDTELKTTAGSLKKEVIDQKTTSQRVKLESIEPNPGQPRKDFDNSALKELAESIKLHNIIQPLTVAAIGNGKYRLIAGERRYRAAKLAQLPDVPVYIRDTGDSDILELALLENLQRENLNAIEVAIAYKRLMDDLDYTQEQVADRMGKERSTVTNYIRLLKLPPDIQVAVRNNIISMAHARALINIDTVDKQLYIFSVIKEKGLSVKQTDELVKKLNVQKTGTVKASTKNSLSPAYKKIEDNLASHFGTRVRLNHAKTGRGSILFEYYSLEELNALLEKLNIRIS